MREPGCLTISALPQLWLETPQQPVYTPRRAKHAPDNHNTPRGPDSSLMGLSGIGDSDMKLNELRDNEGATKKRMRVGRGPGSGKGKMGGRGIKGQNSRSGVAIKSYEDGQMPLYMRLPKRGFNKPNRKAFAVVNLGLIEKFITDGKLDASNTITEDALIASGLVRRKRDGVRVLAKGEISTKINLQVTGVSKSAQEAVEKAGGTVEILAPAPKKEAAEAE